MQDLLLGGHNTQAQEETGTLYVGKKCDNRARDADKMQAYPQKKTFQQAREVLATAELAATVCGLGHEIQ
eukprot:1811912-Amphidinium_carterae.1